MYITHYNIIHHNIYIILYIIKFIYYIYLNMYIILCTIIHTHTHLHTHTYTYTNTHTHQHTGTWDEWSREKLISCKINKLHIQSIPIWIMFKVDSCSFLHYSLLFFFNFGNIFDFRILLFLHFVFKKNVTFFRIKCQNCQNQ